MSGRLRALARSWLAQPAWLRWLAVVAAMAWIWYESAQPPRLPGGGAFRSLGQNALHVPAFGGVAVLWYFALPPRPWRARSAVLAALAYGIVDEVHQSFTPGRVASWTDVLSDLTGALLGVSLLLWILEHHPRARRMALTMLPVAMAAIVIATLV